MLLPNVINVRMTINIIDEYDDKVNRSIDFIPIADEIYLNINGSRPAVKH